MAPCTFAMAASFASMSTDDLLWLAGVIQHTAKSASESLREVVVQPTFDDTKK
jgi:hypothetical protein